MDAAEERHYIRQVVANCTRCDLHTSGQAVPFKGPAPARISVLGMAPGPQEVILRRPFVGASGRTIDRFLRQVGLEPTEMFWCNAISHFIPPGTPPDKRHLEACSGIKHLQLALAASPFLLIVGQDALQSLRPDLQIKFMHGRLLWFGKGRPMNGLPVHWGPVQGFCIHHPAAALRQPSFGQAILKDLALFAQCVHAGDIPPLDTCLRCDKEVDFFDENGVGYCMNHRASQPSLPLSKEGR